MEVGGARRPLPNKKMVHMALALSYAILQRVPDLTYAEGVAIMCVYNATLSYLHTALNTLRHWVNATDVRREKYEQILVALHFAKLTRRRGVFLSKRRRVRLSCRAPTGSR